MARAYGLPEPTRQPSLNVPVPLSDGTGAAEKDNGFQGMRASTLMNAAGACSKAEVRRAYVSILANRRCLRHAPHLAALYREAAACGLSLRSAFLPVEAESFGTNATTPGYP